MTPAVRFYPYPTLKQLAGKFLEKYHPAGDIPIPIEEIVELQLRINVVPVPGLLQFGVDAYTWSDLKTIVVDKYFYDRNVKRLRFTLAHELGHILLHSEVIKACPRNSVEDYQKYVGSIGAKDHAKMESQADCFAGLVLVPPTQLAAKYKEAQALGLANGLSLNDPTVRAHIADWISDFFVVSAGTVDMRMCYDGHWPFKPRKRE